MKCSKCGAEIPDGTKFCGNCGSMVDETEKNSLISQSMVKKPVDKLKLFRYLAIGVAGLLALIYLISLLSSGFTSTSSFIVPTTIFTLISLGLCVPYFLNMRKKEKSDSSYHKKMDMVIAICCASVFIVLQLFGSTVGAIIQGNDTPSRRNDTPAFADSSPTPTFESTSYNEYVETADTALGARFNMDIKKFCNRLMETIPNTKYKESDWLKNDASISDGKHTYDCYVYGNEETRKTAKGVWWTVNVDNEGKIVLIRIAVQKEAMKDSQQNNSGGDTANDYFQYMINNTVMAVTDLTMEQTLDFENKFVKSEHGIYYNNVYLEWNNDEEWAVLTINPVSNEFLSQHSDLPEFVPDSNPSPTTSGSIPEQTSPSPQSFNFTNYVGEWVEEGQKDVYGARMEGGYILTIKDIDDSNISFVLECVQANDNRVAEIDITCPLDNKIGRFEFGDDGWGNNGSGKIEITDESIYLSFQMPEDFSTDWALGYGKFSVGLHRAAEAMD